MKEFFARTPHYVLRHQLNPIGPMTDGSSGVNEVIIFGFSDKPEYDAFLRKSPLALAPYPLVRGYLHRHLEEAGPGLKLVVLDATGPTQSRLIAATMKATLVAIESKLETVPVSFELGRDEATGRFRIVALVSSQC